MSRQLTTFLFSPFIDKGNINKTLLIIFVLINGIVLFNALAHHPAIGYDAKGHLQYIVNAHEVLTTFQLPTQNISKEFFSPPLPYAIPAVFYTLIKKPFELFGLGIEPYSGLEYSLLLTGKFAQLLNVLASLVLTFYLLKICEILRPNNLTLKITSLGLLGMLPVYYKTFAFVRGEPFVALFSVLVTYRLLLMMGLEKKSCGRLPSVILGVLLGLLLLSRQWGFFLLPAIALSAVILFIKHQQKAVCLIKALIISCCIALALSGWFYVLLKVKVGQMDAFNRQVSGFSFSNQPAKFYFGLGLEDLAVFRKPTRTAFRNQLLPVFYSDMWGDYWTRFSETGYDPVHGYDWSKEKSNRYYMRPYLGRVNLFSLFPTAILLVGFMLGLLYVIKNFRPALADQDRVISMFALLQLIIMISLAGYLWFLISYPHPNKGDTIKASYMLHIFPFLTILAGEFLSRMKETAPRVYYSVLVLLVLIFLHNIPAMITHYSHFTVGAMRLLP